MARWRDVATSALRQLGVVAHADMASGAKDALETILADLNGSWGGCTLTFGVDDAIPATYTFGLSRLLAARLAPIYSVSAPEPEKTALLRVRAVNLPYVRDMDLDEDDETTEEEIAAVDRSAYY
jgi:hypothetical protein